MTKFPFFRETLKNYKRNIKLSSELTKCIKEYDKFDQEIFDSRTHYQAALKRLEKKWNVVSDRKPPAVPKENTAVAE